MTKFLRLVASILVFSFSLQTLSFANSQFISIPSHFIALQEADAYAALDSQVKSVSDQIEADSQAAFTALTVQEANLKKEILRQEVSPVVYDYYRRVLGRDPSSAEYDYWISRMVPSTTGTR